MRHHHHIFALSSFLFAGVAFGVDLDSRFTYQGQFKDEGVPVNGTAEIRFSLWDSAGAGCPAVGGAQIGANHTLLNVAVNRGLFSVEVSTGGEFGPNAFRGQRRWLQVAVRHPAGGGSYMPLCPRQEITATPYAHFAADGPFWSLTGNVGTDVASNFVGTTDEQPLELRVNGDRALRLEWAFNDYDGLNTPHRGVNVVGGYQANTIQPGVVAGTIAGGGFEIPVLHAAGVLTINQVTDLGGTVGGGAGNIAGDGGGDVRSATFATVGGGAANVALADYATVPGGDSNVAGGDWSFAAGRNAHSTHLGAFVWADSGAAHFASTAMNQFRVRAGGGFELVAPSGNSSVILPTDSISAAEILDEARLVNDDYSDDNINLPDAFTTLLTRSITAPAAGHVLVLATAQLIFTHANGTQSWAQIAISNSQASFPSSHDLGVVIPAASVSGEYAFPVTGHRVFTVSAGTHTYYLLADERFGNWRVNDLQLTAIYFSTAGVAEALATSAPPTSDDAAAADRVTSREIGDMKLENHEHATAEQLLAELATLQRRVAALEQNTDRVSATTSQE